MAVESRKQAVGTNFISTDSEETVANHVFDMWNKKMVIDKWGDQHTLELQDKLDCVEVFDFFYLFVLKKLLPQNSTQAWIDAISSEWLFNDFYENDPDNSESWETFLTYCRWALPPKDLVDLVVRRKDKSQPDFPTDKHQYLTLQGTFDIGIPSNLCWISYTERWSMVQGLLDVEVWHRFETTTPCWWDRLRQTIGSPFQPDFFEKALSKISEATSNEAELEGSEGDSEDSEGSENSFESYTKSEDLEHLKMFDIKIIVRNFLTEQFA